MYTVYKHLDQDENILYIGKSKSLLYRQRQHKKNAEWFDEVDSIEYQIFNSKIEMDIAELYYINKYSPQNNIKDKRSDTVDIVNVEEDFIKFDMNELIEKERKRSQKLDEKDLVRYDNILNNISFKDFNEKEFDILIVALNILKNNNSNDLIIESSIFRKLCRYTADAKYYSSVNKTYKNFITNNNIPLFDKFCISEDKKYMNIKLNDNYRDILNPKINYTEFSLNLFLDLKGVYSKRLYMLLKLNNKRRRAEFNIDEFRTFLDVPTTYRMSDIDRRVFIFSIKEIQEKTDIKNIKITKVKKLKNIDKLIFTWG